MSTSRQLVLGIDGGGSKTRALLVDRDGTVLGEAVAASSNYRKVGFAKATAALREVITATRDQAGAAPAAIGAACLGLAGVGRDADRELLARWIESEQVAARYLIINDAELVLAAGIPADSGIALICGTGSVCYGRGPSGELVRSGGWGHLVGDEGSGYNIAVRAIQLATQTADGRADADALLRAVLDYWQVEHAERLIGRIYDSETTLAEIAGLAPAVLTLAEQGDPHARRLLDGAAAALARLLEAVVRKLGVERPPVALGGSLLCASHALRAAVVGKTTVALGETCTVDKPVLGAIALARRLLDA